MSGEISLSKSYEPQTFESTLYRFWEENGCFEAADTPAPGQKNFCIVIPPPNVTGVLHMGHALTNTLQDILIRWHRMRGDNTLWLPGTDHAGIATQAQVEKTIAKEGRGPTGKPLTRHDLGRKAFIQRTWKWKEDHGSEITHQTKRLGSSLDWARERFTMDEGLSAAVREVFVRLYEEGLIYRGERIINWCARCQTALSDLEVIPTDRKGYFWSIQYSIEGSPDYLTISTTRPETLLGDAAVAVHPDDERYKAFYGKKVILPLLSRLIPIITDPYVDKEFGTGALKVTPAHDFNDYEIGKRHSLPIISVMGKDGKITAAGGPYAGLKFLEARESVIRDLKEAGLLVKTEDHAHKVGLCQRCDNIAEPMISEQWFVKIKPLAQKAIQAVETGKTTFTPKNWEKTYFEWMHNIRDWCISRQLWWGHQIPAWYCKRCQGITVARVEPQHCSQCNAPASDLKRDEDVLDTWFSSALWPFSTLGWPEKTQALKTFYPTSILETGFDIIFFWVARMMMMGLHFMGEVPFKKVYLHAMVRDEKGEKMSKSKGNVIDPLVLIDKHGADPLRFTLAAMAGQGRDIKLSVNRVEGYRAFCNKLWNATKYFHLQWEAITKNNWNEPVGGMEQWFLENKNQLLPENQWILSLLQKLIITTEKGLEEFEINTSAQVLYQFAWNEFCDWYIEFTKVLLKKDGAIQKQTLFTLYHVLNTLLKLLHPFMPFVTEKLWQSLPWKKPVATTVRQLKGKSAVVTLMLQEFPQQNKNLLNPSAEEMITSLKTVIESLRNFRGENNIPTKNKFPVFYHSTQEESIRWFQAYLETICALANLEKLEFFLQNQTATKKLNFATIQISSLSLELRINLEGLVNRNEETDRLKKEIEKLNADLVFVQNKLSKPSFIEKAPPALVKKERSREQELQSKLNELGKALARLERI